MSIFRNFPHILHGGDYNPDQWLDYPDVIDRDFVLMDKAHCNTFSVGIFSWSQYEPEEGKFNFAWMDDLFERCAKHGKKLLLATPSGGRPAWLGTRYPETCRVLPDGRREEWRGRHNHCWTSPVMREKLSVIIGKLAERYAGHPALAGWHVSNEYNGECRCPLCLKKFQEFLKDRYFSLENLNRAYWSGFWSHGFSDWDQISLNDGALDLIHVDWLRFNTRQLCDFMAFEIGEVRKKSDAPVTTNMMGWFPGVDYWRVAGLCDFIADDCYPTWYNGETEHTAARFAALHDMHYTMGDKPFVMMESCPGIPNYKPYCKIRRPNEFQREMLLALGHGAEGTMYFQWRKGLGNCEKFHGAVVGHDDRDDTLVFQRVADYGARLEHMAEICGSRIHPKVGVLFDWESNWCLANCKGFGGSSAQQPEETVLKHYQALWSHNVPLAVPESLSDFSRYSLLVAPMLFMLKPGVAERMAEFVRAGGTLVMTYLSGYVDENNLCFRGGFPGGVLRGLFGIRNEDIDIFEPSTEVSILLNGFSFAGKTEFPVSKRCEYIHPEGAEVLAVYHNVFYAGHPALTVNRFGKGKAVYLAAEMGEDFLHDFYGKILSEAGIRPVLPNLPPAVRASKRFHDRFAYYFLLNMTDREQKVSLPRKMEDLWNGGRAVTEVMLPSSGGTVLKAAEIPEAAPSPEGV